MNSTIVEMARPMRLVDGRNVPVTVRLYPNSIEVDLGVLGAFEFMVYDNQVRLVRSVPRAEGGVSVTVEALPFFPEGRHEQ